MLTSWHIFSSLPSKGGIEVERGTEVKKTKTEVRKMDLKRFQNWFLVGAVIGIVISLILPPIIAWLVGTTGVTGVTFAAYNVREQFANYAAQGNAFAGYILSFIGGGISLPGVVITAIGLGSLMYLLRVLFDVLGINMSFKWKLFAIVVLATVVAGYVVSKSLPVFAIEPMIFMVITGAMISFVAEQVSKALKLPLN
jgi:hypothetical protein